MAEESRTALPTAGLLERLPSTLLDQFFRSEFPSRWHDSGEAVLNFLDGLLLGTQGDYGTCQAEEDFRALAMGAKRLAHGRGNDPLPFSATVARMILLPLIPG